MKFAFQRSLLRSKISHETIRIAFDEKVVTSEAIASVNRQFFSEPSKAAFCKPSCCRCIGPKPVQHLKKMKKLLTRKELVDKKVERNENASQLGRHKKKTEKGETCSSQAEFEFLFGQFNQKIVDLSNEILSLFSTLPFRISEAFLKSQSFYVKFTTQLSPKKFSAYFFLQNVQALLRFSLKR